MYLSWLNVEIDFAYSRVTWSVYLPYSKGNIETMILKRPSPHSTYISR